MVRFKLDAFVNGYVQNWIRVELDTPAQAFFAKERRPYVDFNQGPALPIQALLKSDLFQTWHEIDLSCLDAIVQTQQKILTHIHFLFTKLQVLFTQMFTQIIEV